MWDSYIQKISQKYDIPAELLKAQIQQESGGKSDAVSYAGAVGISQFMAATGHQYGLIELSPEEEKNVRGMGWSAKNRHLEQLIAEGKATDYRTDAKKSIEAQGQYMRDLKKAHGTWERALSAYNSGKPDAYLNPDFAQGQTYNYVNNIMNAWGTTKISPTETPMDYPDFANNSKNEKSIPVIDAESGKLVGSENRSTGKRTNFVSTPEKQESDFSKSMEEKEKSTWQKIMDAISSFGKVEASEMPTNRSFQPPMSKAIMPESLDRQFHTVQPGDTLWGIAQRTLGSGNRWKELTGYSGDPRKLQVGTQIGTPQRQPTLQRSQPARQPTYSMARSTPQYSPARSIPQQPVSPPSAPVSRPSAPVSRPSQPKTASVPMPPRSYIPPRPTPAPTPAPASSQAYPIMSNRGGPVLYSDGSWR